MIKDREHLLELLRQHFGLDEFRPVQEEVILRTIGGGHTLLIMPTGMGKSLCYQLPALVLPGLTVVISPLISLMKDQTDYLVSRGIDAACINSAMSSGERQAVYEGISDGSYRVILVAPERFRRSEFRDAIGRREISLLVVDEAHCVSQWGHDFRPDYTRIGEFRKIAGNPVTLAMTATATPAVQEDIIVALGLDPSQVQIFNQGICRDNLYLEAVEVIDEEEKYRVILEALAERKGSGIVYFNLISSIEKFARHLQMKKIPFMIYHGRLERRRRASVQQAFMESTDAIMLATNAFGMGIDKRDIRFVIHAEVPDSLEAYYQEIGRAGRDGLDSRCMLIFCQDDLAVQMDFLRFRNPDAAFISRTYSLLESLGDSLPSFTYEELQDRLVNKNRGDMRLATVLNLFDRYDVTEGDLEAGTLRLAGELTAELISPERLAAKLDMDRRRLGEVVLYFRNEGCRREYIHRYFSAPYDHCGHCDHCY